MGPLDELAEGLEQLTLNVVQAWDKLAFNLGRRLHVGSTSAISDGLNHGIKNEIHGRQTRGEIMRSHSSHAGAFLVSQKVGWEDGNGSTIENVKIEEGEAPAEKVNKVKNRVTKRSTRITKINSDTSSGAERGEGTITQSMKGGWQDGLGDRQQRTGVLKEWVDDGELEVALPPMPPPSRPVPEAADMAADTAWEQSTFASLLHRQKPEGGVQKTTQGPVTREELGRATWTFLHTLAAQYPERPTKQQQRDVKELLTLLTRIYPCAECASHFKEVLKTHTPNVSSGAELAQYMCRVHNVVNRSLNKAQFPCEKVEARWGALHCDEGACMMPGRA